ncbi:undecaprenyl-phosphate glucose phosphotransferase [Myxococcota bacterium]|nr:undecaprenyl-phosphate glucose phosphotransferase [Myxococcota bacterium]
MLRRYHKFFQSIQIFRDTFLIALSFGLAYSLRFAFPEYLSFHSVSDPREVLWVGVVLTLVWPIVGWVGGLYISRRTRSLVAELFDVLKTSLITLLVVVTLTYFIRDERFSRAVLMIWAMASVLVVAGARGVSRLLLREVRAAGYNLRHVIVVGSSDLAARVVEVMGRQLSLGMRVSGIVARDEDADKVGMAIDGVPIIGTVKDLATIVGENRPDQVLVALPIERLGALKQIMAVLSQETVDVRVIPDFYQYMTLNGSVEEFAGLPIINLQSSPMVGWYSVAKRAFDFTVAIVASIFAAPIMLGLAALVRFSSRGPIFYSQERSSIDGSTFNMYKFRTMVVEAEDAGAQMTAPNDPRTTRIGRVMRKLSLDELPQLWNVLRGEMSLVGPRPERPCFVEEFKKDIPRYALRHKIKAGMTGWAQVNGMRGQTSISERIEFDLYYIENWSLLLDLKILVRTVLGGFLSPNAY